jgi:FixJ family two-component response regulator
MTKGTDTRAVVHSMEAGGFSLLTTPLAPDKLLRCIRRAVASALAEHRQRQRVEELEQRLNGLSGRERDVLRLVSQGKPSKHISRALGIGERTVETHRGNIMRKLGADSIVEAVALWVEYDVLSRGDVRS